MKLLGLQKMKTAAITVLCSLTLLSITVSITVIVIHWKCTRVRVLPSDVHADILKDKLDRIYVTMRLPGQQRKQQAGNTDRQGPSLKFLSLLKPVAHLSGITYPTAMLGQKETIIIRNWTYSGKSEIDLLYNGIDYQDGCLVPPSTGTYFVYSHVTFYNNSNSEKRGLSFKHMILRYDASKMKVESVLISNTKELNKYSNVDVHMEYQSGIRGLVELNIGDHVCVKVSPLSCLTQDDDDMPYFGMYFI